jgi:hypothetical protein
MLRRQWQDYWHGRLLRSIHPYHEDSTGCRHTCSATLEQLQVLGDVPAVFIANSRVVFHTQQWPQNFA